MPYKDLEVSAKFSKYLAQQGLLIPVVNAYEEYRRLENFPFQVKDKQVFRAAILKALCARTDLTIAKIEMTADKWVDEMYDLYPDVKIDKTMEELLKKYKVPKEFENQVVFMSQTLDKDSFNAWIKTAVKDFEEKKIVESADPKEIKQLQDKKLNKEMSDKLNVIAAEHKTKTKKSSKTTKK